MVPLDAWSQRPSVNFLLSAAHSTSLPPLRTPPLRLCRHSPTFPLLAASLTVLAALRNFLAVSSATLHFDAEEVEGLHC